MSFPRICNWLFTHVPPIYNFCIAYTGHVLRLELIMFHTWFYLDQDRILFRFRLNKGKKWAPSASGWSLTVLPSQRWTAFSSKRDSSKKGLGTCLRLWRSCRVCWAVARRLGWALEVSRLTWACSSGSSREEPKRGCVYSSSIKDWRRRRQWRLTSQCPPDPEPHQNHTLRGRMLTF